MPLRLLLACLCAAAILSVPPASAREIAPAVEIEPIGFSPDGRYFAWEELIVGDGNGGPAVLVHVLDRTGNKPAAGFPFGLPESETEDPAKPGEDKWKRLGLKEDSYSEMPEHFERLRADIRKLAAPKLEALNITARPRRVAGLAFTQAAPVAPAVSFKLQGELLGGVPDQQPLYRLRAQMPPESAKCFNETPKTIQKSVALTLETFTARNGRMASKPDATSRHTIAFATNEECPQTLRLSDIFAAPVKEGVKQAFVAVLFVQSWKSHADTSRLLAMFFEVE